MLGLVFKYSSTLVFSLVKKYLAEGIGTFVLVFLGTLAAVTSQGNVMVTALVFGCTLAVLSAVFGPLSGAHVNPAVSLGAWLGGTLSTSDVVPYWISQFLGGVCGSLALRMMLGAGQPLGGTTFTMLTPLTALLLEGVLTFLFVSTVLCVQAKDEKLEPEHAALLIGGAFLVLHLVAIPLTGAAHESLTVFGYMASLNPARSIAPVVVGANALAASQLWVYVLGPFIGGALAGILLRVRRG